MEQSEIYFRQLDRLIARDNFPEKESIDATVHHLEVRTGFFDKLAVLAAGSLAVGISFITAGYQRTSLEHVIHHYLWWLAAALFCILLSLISCVIHNYLTSSAVFLLSRQLESLSQGASRKTIAFEVYSAGAAIPPHINDSLNEFKEQSESTKIKRARRIAITMKTGLVAIALFIIGYVMGFAVVVSIIAS